MTFAFGQAKATERSEGLTLQLAMRLRGEDSALEHPHQEAASRLSLDRQSTQHLVNFVDARDSTSEGVLHRSFEHVFLTHASQIHQRPRRRCDRHPMPYSLHLF